MNIAPSLYSSWDGVLVSANASKSSIRALVQRLVRLSAPMCVSPAARMPRGALRSERTTSMDRVLTPRCHLKASDQTQLQCEPKEPIQVHR
jgi:hypothetical protein